MFRKLFQNVKFMQHSRTFLPFTHHQSLCNPILVNSSLPKIQCLFFMTTKYKQLHVDNKITKITDTNQSILKLEKILRCNKLDATKLYEYLSRNCEWVNIDAINKTVKWLRRIGASSPVILKNCHILLLPLGRHAFVINIFNGFFCKFLEYFFINIFLFFIKDDMKNTYQRLQRSEWNQIDDFVPFLALKESKIKKIQTYRSHRSHAIRDRVYLFHECFAVILFNYFGDLIQ